MVKTSGIPTLNLYYYLYIYLRPFALQKLHPKRIIYYLFMEFALMLSNTNVYFNCKAN